MKGISRHMLEGMAREASIAFGKGCSTADFESEAAKNLRHEAEAWVEKTAADPRLLLGKDYNKMRSRGASVFFSLNLGFD